MKRWYRTTMILITILLSWTITSTMSSSAQQNEDDDASVLHIDSAVVFCDVSVRNSHGKTVENLQTEDFDIYEDGKPQNIEHFINTAAPVELVMVIDISGSTKTKIAVMRQTAINFIRKIDKTDQIALVQFDESAELLSKFTNDQATLEKALDHLGEGEGYGSSVFDAMLFASGLFNNNSGHKAVLMITDGVDNTSRFELQAVKTMLESQSASFYFIELDTETDLLDNFPSIIGAPFTPKQLERYYRSLSLSDKEVKDLMDTKFDFPKDFIVNVTHTLYKLADQDMREVANHMGGRVYKVSRIEDLAEQYQIILDELHKLYTIGYYPNSSSQDESFHKITIKSKRPNLSLFYRSGYRAIDQSVLKAKLDIINKAVGKSNYYYGSGVIGETVNGWFVPTETQQAGYAIKVTEDHPYIGYLSVAINQDDVTKSNSKGICQKNIDAYKYWGKYVKVQASVKIDDSNPGNQAELSLKVHRLSGKSDFINSQTIRSTDNRSKIIEVVGEVAEDAETVTIEVALQGSGKVTFDSIRLDPIGTLGKGDIAPKELTNQELDNLTAFTKLLGYVRYFHPSDEAFHTDWESFTIKGIDLVEKAHNSTELAQILTEICRSIAPTVRVFVTKQKQPQLPQELLAPTNSAQIVCWRNITVNRPEIDNKPETDNKLENIRIYSNEQNNNQEILDPQKPLIIELPGDVSCLVPLALYVDKRGTIPQVLLGSLSKKYLLSTKPADFVPSGKDRTTRLAVVALTWNNFHHVYPYAEPEKTDGQTILRKALTKAASDPNESEFYQTLRQLLAQSTNQPENVLLPLLNHIFLPQLRKE